MNSENAELTKERAELHPTSAELIVCVRGEPARVRAELEAFSLEEHHRDAICIPLAIQQS